MNTKEFSNIVCKEIKYKPANKPILEELETHIEDIKNDNLCKGYSEKEAEEKAVEQMGDAKQIGKRLNKIHRPKLDWKILVLIAILLAFRMIIDIKSDIEWHQFYGREYNVKEFLGDHLYMIRNIIMAVIIFLIIYFFDYRKTKKWANAFYFLATGIILFQYMDMIVIDNLMNTIFDDSLVWFVNMRLWNISVPLYIIAFAGYMAEYKKEDFWDMVILYTISCILLYFKSESIMNTSILIISYLAILASKILNKTNIKKIILICGGILGIAIIIMITMSNLRIPYIFNGNISEISWNETNRAEMQTRILENVNWVGKADADVLNGRNSNFQFIHILAIFGIIPALVLVAIILLMSIRLIKNSKSIEDVYGKYLIIGLSTTYILQSFIQVLMNINLLPISDVNLPFVSQGNLYFLINTFTFAVMLSVYRRKNINFETVLS